ncbi:MAG TPA: hypothetical protein ENH92_01970 [Ectothiorhodospiraceae bacterium]|nr:hypothetical protein [Ectothiorhodospiraceae bacterium]
MKHVAARREPQRNGYSIAKVRNAADACFKSRPTGHYTLSRLCVMFSHQAVSMLSKTGLAYMDVGKGREQERKL